MTFTRSSDADTLTPTLVFGPFEVEREVRNISRELLHSNYTVSTFVPTVHRTGEFQCLFTTHAEAKAAAEWFTAASLFVYEGAATTAGDLIVDEFGYVVPAEPGDLDTSFETQFIVWGGALSIRQNQLWELTVPYKEIVEA